MQVLTRQALLVRLGRRGLDRALVAGDWQRVMRGAYVQGGVALDLGVRARAANLLLPERAFLADRCLLWLLGIDVLPPGPPVLEAVVPTGTVVPRRAGIRVREAQLPLRDRGDVHDVRCLRPVRAVADLLRRLPLAEAVVVADASQRAKLVSQEAIRQELTRHAGLRGVRQAHLVVGLSDPLSASPPESRLRLVLVQAGLRPTVQHDVHDARGRWLARVDLAFPAYKVALEYDGREAHERADVFTRDRRRQNDLVRAGWIVLRFCAADVRRPAWVVQQVREALVLAAA